MRFSANVSFLFTDVPFLDRFDRAARAGFRAVEFMWPGAVDHDDLCAAVRSSALEVSMFNLPEGNVDAGELGLLSDPDREKEYRDGALEGLDLAQRLRCKRIHTLAGNRHPAMSRHDQLDIARERLKWTAAKSRRSSIQVLVEPLNAHDNFRYLVPRVGDVVSLIQSVGMSDLRLLYDTYHVASMNDDVCGSLQRYFSEIGHIQVGDYPGRVEPGKGVLPFTRFFATLTKLRYSGYVGVEYQSGVQATEQTLGWMGVGP